MVGTESDKACSIAAFFSFTYFAKSISAFVSAMAMALIVCELDDTEDEEIFTFVLRLHDDFDDILLAPICAFANACAPDDATIETLIFAAF